MKKKIIKKCTDDIDEDGRIEQVLNEFSCRFNGFMVNRNTSIFN